MNSLITLPILSLRSCARVLAICQASSSRSMVVRTKASYHQGADVHLRQVCYADFVTTSITLTLPEELLNRLREDATKANTSVSRLVGRVMAEEMRRDLETVNLRSRDESDKRE